MVKTIDMQDLRHLNLFNQITKINTRFCFRYNDTLYFCVPKNLISKALGENASNIRRMSDILKRRIKVIPKPRGIEDAEGFIKTITALVTFKELEVKDNEIILNAGGQNKATLFGRNKQRFFEMKSIVKGFFDRDFKII